MKKIIYILIIVLCFILSYFIYRRLSFNNLINDVIDHDTKINYDTMIQLTLDNQSYSSKIELDIRKADNIKKITINNYRNNKLESNIYEYWIKENKKYITYVYNGIEFEKRKSVNMINIDYKKLKDCILKIKSKRKNTYIVSMKAYDAYNIIYGSEVLSKKDLNKKIDVKIVKDDNKNFIKEISYKIDNLNNSSVDDKKTNYSVKIKNINIDNTNKIKLPFKR